MPNKLDLISDSFGKLADSVSNLKHRVDSFGRKDAARSGYAPAELKELDKKHEREMEPLLKERDKLEWRSPEWKEFQKKVNALGEKQSREREALKAKISR